MYRIAVCDDEELSLRLLTYKLNTELEGRNISAEVIPFANGTELLTQLQSGIRYDAVFLDIVMPEFDGISTGSWLRDNKSSIPIIYVSNRDDMVFRTFTARPFQYIRKSQLDEELPTVIDELFSEIRRRKKDDDSFKIDTDNREVFSFHANKIMYIEVNGKECLVWQADSGKSQVTKCRLKVYEDILESRGFIKVHKSFLVNYRYIFQIGSTELKLDNGKSLPISKHRLNDVKSAFLTLSTSDK